MLHKISKFLLIVVSATLLAGCSFSISSQPQNTLLQLADREAKSANVCDTSHAKTNTHSGWHLKIDFSRNTDFPTGTFNVSSTILEITQSVLGKGFRFALGTDKFQSSKF